jgi:predicted O-methyltransferase YrrM
VEKEIMFVSLENLSSESSPRTGDIEKVMIQEKLKELGHPVESLSLGKFDYIGEFTAKKQRSPDSENFHSAGAFFRPNYERGMLIYSLIKSQKLESYLEIGYGRGYSCFCAAMAFSELGRGSITTVDPAFNEDQVRSLASVFPQGWFSMIEFQKGTSDEFFAAQPPRDFDLIYIDGDHRYDFVKRDWENCKERFKSYLIFDDYHLPGKVQKDMEVSAIVDAINDYNKELIIMDRRVFHDDRGYSDDQINYGQVLVHRK